MSIKFYPILPIKFLKRYGDIFTNHMILAQELLSNDLYSSYYKELSKDLSYDIMLDNGACELGKSIKVSNLVDILKNIIMPDTLVIPDSLKDWETEEFYLEFFSSYNKFKDLKVRKDYCNFMGVPKNEFQALAMSFNPYVDIIGLNREFELKGGRSSFIYNFINTYGSVLPLNSLKFHYLGIRRNPIDEIKSIYDYGIQDYVISFDSSLPYRILKEGRRLSTKEIVPYPPMMDFKEDLPNNSICSFVLEEFKFYEEFLRGLDSGN